MTLNRSAPLKAKTPLKRTPIKRKKVLPSAQHGHAATTGLPVKRAVKSRPKKKPKKPTSTQYKLWCDTLFSQIVRARGVCLRCGKTADLQCSHIVSRGYLATRWNEQNAICACKGCHHWQHMNPQ